MYVNIEVNHSVWFKPGLCLLMKLACCFYVSFGWPYKTNWRVPFYLKSLCRIDNTILELYISWLLWFNVALE